MYCSNICYLFSNVLLLCYSTAILYVLYCSFLVLFCFVLCSILCYVLRLALSYFSMLCSVVLFCFLFCSLSYSLFYCLFYRSSDCSVFCSAVFYCSMVCSNLFSSTVRYSVLLWSVLIVLCSDMLALRCTFSYLINLSFAKSVQLFNVAFNNPRDMFA